MAAHADCSWTKREATTADAAGKVDGGLVDSAARTGITIWSPRVLSPLAPTCNFFWWLFGHASVFLGAGYLAAFSLRNNGDVNDGVVRDLPYAFTWRALGAILGIVIYRAAMIHAENTAIGSRAVVPYLAIGITNTLAGLLNPDGLSGGDRCFFGGNFPPPMQYRRSGSNVSVRSTIAQSGYQPRTGARELWSEEPCSKPQPSCRINAHAGRHWSCGKRRVPCDHTAFVAAALSAAAVLVIGIGSTLARTSGGDIVGVLNPNASCTSANPCLEEDNKSTGSGLTGTSKKGTGVVGNTSFLSTSSTNATAGVFGQDLNPNDKFNAGVLGTSKNGFGLLGVSTNGTAVFGKSTKNAGVTGSSANGIGVTGSGAVGGVFGAGGSSGFGLEGFGFQGVVGANTADSTSDALVATGFGGNLIRANNSQNIDVLTLDDSGFLDTINVLGERGVFGVCASPCTGAAVVGTTNVPGAVGVRGTANDQAAVGVGTPFGDIFEGSDGNTTVFAVDTSGNIGISGQIFTQGSCHLGCSRTRKIESYVPHESAPMSEDVGEAQFVGGQAYVRFDPAFANVIDHTTKYSVFITPEGDNRGLYVTNKSPSGFEVRESQGGRSTLAFSYRIVAKPYGETEARLPMVNLKSGPRPAFVRPHKPVRSAPKASRFPKP